jgi:hypothetical protein
VVESMPRLLMGGMMSRALLAGNGADAFSKWKTMRRCHAQLLPRRIARDAAALSYQALDLSSVLFFGLRVCFVLGFCGLLEALFEGDGALLLGTANPPLHEPRMKCNQSEKS